MHTVDALKSAYEGVKMKTKKSGKASERADEEEKIESPFKRLVAQTQVVERTKRVKMSTEVFDNYQVRSSFFPPLLTYQ